MIQKFKKNIFLKVLYGVYHPVFWFFFLMAIILIAGGAGEHAIAESLINMTFIFAVIPINVIVHETGHLVMGKVVGAVPRRMVLGKGHKMTDFKIGNIKIILNSPLNSGLAYATHTNLKWIRFKIFVFSLGGILFNAVAALITILIFGFNLRKGVGFDFAEMFVLSNLLIALFALFPYRTNYFGFPSYSDGLAMLRIPFIKKQELAELIYSNDILDSIDFIEEKKYHEGIEVLVKYREATGQILIPNLNQSIAYLKLGELDKSIELLEELIPALDTEHVKFKAHICNALAWNYLLTNRLDEADKYSEEAFKLNNAMPEICGTRAGVLMERGEYEIGIRILEPSVSLAHATSHNLTAAIYLAYAYQLKKDKKKSLLYLRFVDENLDKLDWDERIVYHRLIDRMKSSEAP
jgi:tetratricopeptide (TPR) repeat protein